jgi:hypothetical protein
MKWWHAFRTYQNNLKNNLKNVIKLKLKSKCGEFFREKWEYYEKIFPFYFYFSDFGFFFKCKKNLKLNKVNPNLKSSLKPLLVG